ncbi:DUF5753 domain-containing protein [Embleya sp. AB8]|uniref:DUF5753 domain-containing protein n=1 Tax=Embleya sp. AB8 TaxID=3156304 RepID=UPI003C77A75B
MRPLLSRIENGHAEASAADLELLCAIYEIGAEDRRQLEQYARDGQPRSKNWWTHYGDVLSASYTEYIAWENEAVRYFDYLPLGIPGLLQTRDYARAMHTGGYFGFGEMQIDDLVDVRMQRQKLLDGPEPLVVEGFVHEAALHIQLGGRAVLHGQLAYLREAMGRPNVNLHIIPNTACAMLTISNGITVLEFPDDDPDVTFFDVVGATLLREDPRDARRARRIFGKLTEVALTSGAAEALLSSRMKETK